MRSVPFLPLMLTAKSHIFWLYCTLRRHPIVSSGSFHVCKSQYSLMGALVHHYSSCISFASQVVRMEVEGVRRQNWNKIPRWQSDEHIDSWKTSSLYHLEIIIIVSSVFGSLSFGETCIIYRGSPVWHEKMFIENVYSQQIVARNLVKKNTTDVLLKNVFNCDVSNNWRFLADCSSTDGDLSAEPHFTGSFVHAVKDVNSSQLCLYIYDVMWGHDTYVQLSGPL